MRIIDSSKNIIKTSTENNLSSIEAASLSVEQGDLWWQEDRLDRAIDCYRQAVELAPKNPQVHQKLAVALKHQGKLDEASKYYRQAIVLDDDKINNVAEDSQLSLSSSINLVDKAQTNFSFQTFNHSHSGKYSLGIKSEAAQVYLHQALSYCQEQQWERAIEVCQNILQLTPGMAEAYKVWGNALQKMGKVSEAIGCYAKAIEIQPNLAEVYANIGSLYAQQKNWQNAIKFFQKAIVIAPDFAGAYRNLGKVWQQLGETDKAYDCNYRALQLEPDKVTAQEHYSIGDRLLEQDKLTEAIDCFQNAIKLNPNLTDSYQKLAETLEKVGDYQQAVGYYRQLIEMEKETAKQKISPKMLNPSPNSQRNLPQLQPAIEVNSKLDSAATYADRGMQYAGQQQWKKAIACYQKAIELDANFVEAYRNLAKIFTQIGQKERASDLWFEVLNLDPNSAKAEQHYHLGNTLVEQDKIEKAITCYRRAIQLMPNLAEAYLRLGQISSDRSQKQQAIDYYRQALTHNANLSDGYYLLAEALVGAQEWDEAIFCYRQAIILQPNYAQAHHNLGELLNKQQRWSEAVIAYRQAIELNPDFSWSHNNLADVLLKQGQWQEAIYAYRYAIRLNPDFVWSYYNLAEALVELEKWDEAIESYQKALQVKPDLKEADEKLNDLLNRRAISDIESAFNLYLQAIEREPTDIEAYLKALEIKPNDLKLHASLANALFSQGEIDAALTIYRKLIKEDSTNSEFQYRLAEALVERQQWNEAILAYRRALELQPALSDISNITEKLDRAIQHNTQATPDYEGSLQFADYPYVKGWVWDKNNPHKQLEVEILLNDRSVITTKADRYREDVHKAGKGDGYKCFKVKLTIEVDRRLTYQVSARVKGSNYILRKSPLTLKFPAQKSTSKPKKELLAKQSPLYEGKLERINARGIYGWVWKKNDTATQLVVEILDGEKVIDRCKADQFRQDLQTAGKGEGKHAFYLPLPPSLYDGKEHLILARTFGTEHYLSSEPLKFTYSNKRPYQNFAEYMKWAMFHREFEYPLAENDKRVLGYMDWYEDHLKKRYASFDRSTKISIIMPAYNRASVISFSIESVLQQSYDNWELIVVDDGSSDNTTSIVKNFNDPRIILYELEQNGGVSKARNKGLSLATGEIIAFLDSDNTWYADFLLLMVNVLRENPDAESIYCAQKKTTIYESEVYGKSETHSILFGPFNRSLLENRNFIDLNAFVHKRSSYQKWGGFSEQMRRLVDWDYILRHTTDFCPIALPCILSQYYHGMVANQITKTEKIDLADTQVTENLQNNPFQLPFPEVNSQNNSIEYTFFAHRSTRNVRKQPFVSIIIPSYEVPEYLEYCVQSILKFTAPGSYELIIVDNGSSPETVAALQRMEEIPEVTVIYNSDNMGFTYAVNQGIEIAQQGADIVLLNNDALVTPGWIEAMVEVVEEEENVGIVVPRQVLIPNTKTMDVHVPSCNIKREMDVSLSVHHDNILQPCLNPVKGFVELAFAPFFCVYITRDCLNKTGSLDAKNGRHYRSDRLYCDVVRNFAQMRVVYTPHSKLYHFLQQATVHLKGTDKSMFKKIFVENTWDESEQKRLFGVQMEQKVKIL